MSHAAIASTPNSPLAFDFASMMMQKRHVDAVAFAYSREDIEVALPGEDPFQPAPASGALQDFPVID